MNKDLQIKAEELWDKYSQHVDENLSSFESIAGQSVITRSDFIKAVSSLSSLPQEDKPNSYKEYKKITGPVKPFAEWAKDQESTTSVSEEIDIAVAVKRIVDDSENVEDLIGKLKSEGFVITKK